MVYQLNVVGFIHTERCDKMNYIAKSLILQNFFFLVRSFLLLLFYTRDTGFSSDHKCIHAFIFDYFPSTVRRAKRCNAKVVYTWIQKWEKLISKISFREKLF